jgi:hypothetical protein
LKIPLDKSLVLCYNNYTETTKENLMNMSSSQYQTALALNEFLEAKENLDFEAALKEHDLTLAELLAHDLSELRSNFVKSRP